MTDQSALSIAIDQSIKAERFAKSKERHRLILNASNRSWSVSFRLDVIQRRAMIDSWCREA
jgi:hypothetical protein